MMNIPGNPVDTDVTAKFRDKLALSPDLRDVFNKQVKSVVWKTKLSPETVQIPRGKSVEEIEIFWLDVNEKEIDEEIIRFFDRKIAYHLIFILENNGKIQIWLSDKIIKQTDESYFTINRYYHTEWFHAEMLYLFPDGNNLDNLYRSLFQQIQRIDKDAELLFKISKIAKHSQALIEIARKHIPLSQQEIETILANKPISDKQKEMITNSYLRVAMILAYKFYHHYACPNDSIDECIADACAGIVNAIDSYDINVNGYFSSYIQKTIWGTLDRQKAERENIIHIPAHINELISVLLKAGHKIRQEQGHEPTVADYAKVMHMSESKIKDILETMQTTISLSTPIEEDEGTVLEDFLADKRSTNLDASTEDLLRKQEVSDVLAKLTEREAKILTYRFGLDSGYPRTLEEVGKMLNVTRERIRQIEKKAIRRLRHPSRARHLQDYKDELEK